MFDVARTVYAQALAEIRAAGLYKDERIIETPQGAAIRTGGREVLNFCANNYLGLSSHPAVIEAAHARSTRTASASPACASSAARRTSTRSSSAPSPASSAPTTPSSTRRASTPTAGLFETLLGEEDAIISDALNHASIIDGIRLCKAERHRYPNGDMAALEEALRKTQGKRLPA